MKSDWEYWKRWQRGIETWESCSPNNWREYWHTLTIRMMGRMTTFGSWTYWIHYGQEGYKALIISMGNMDKENVYRKIWKWFGNEIARNGPDIIKADVVRTILNSDMRMFGRTHGKLWRIWDYGYPVERMIPYDGYGGPRSVWNGTGSWVADQNCCSLDAVRAAEYMCVRVCLCAMSRVKMSICWTRMCISCWFYRPGWVPRIRDIHHGLFALRGSSIRHSVWRWANICTCILCN